VAEVGAHGLGQCGVVSADQARRTMQAVLSLGCGGRPVGQVRLLHGANNGLQVLVGLTRVGLKAHDAGLPEGR